jgi:glycosyltransferase involved in cell wall biosynthesis
MRILHIAHGYFPEGAGGVESYVRDVTAEQRRQGHDPVLLAGSLELWPECGIEEQVVDGLPVLRVHRDDQFFDHYAKAWHPGVERLVRRELARLRPDVVHVHHWIRLTSNLVELARGLGLPAVVTLHDLYASCPRVFRVRRDGVACFRELSVASCVDCVPRYGHESEAELSESIALHHDQFAAELLGAHAVLAATGATAELVAQKTGLSRDRIRVLPLGYAARFAGVTVAEHAATPLRLGYWGSISVHKGVQTLLRAMQLVPAGTPLELHVFGPFDSKALEAELRSLATGLPVTFHAGRFTPATIAAGGLHAAVLPSVCFETFGFVLDEAHELGLPAIVTQIGALPERAGASALVVPPGDAAALAQAMMQLATDPALLSRLRAAIPPRAPTPQQHVAALLEIYTRARAAPAPAAPQVPALRRAEFLLRQRESAQYRITPEGGPQ